MDAETPGRGLELAAQDALPRQDQAEPGTVPPQIREHFQEAVEPLLRLQPAYRPEDDVIGGESEGGPHGRPARRIAPESLGVDAVEDGRHALRAGAAEEELAPDRFGDRDEPREAPEHPFVQGVIEPALAAAVPRPAVHRRYRDHPLRAREHPGQDVRLVIMGMDDADLPLPHQAAERREDPGVERMPLRDLVVVEAERSRALADPEQGVLPRPEITDRHRVPRRVRRRRALQDGLLGTAARPPDAAQLEDSDRSAHAVWMPGPSSPLRGWDAP